MRRRPDLRTTEAAADRLSLFTCRCKCINCRQKGRHPHECRATVHHHDPKACFDKLAPRRADLDCILNVKRNALLALFRYGQCGIDKFFFLHQQRCAALGLFEEIQKSFGFIRKLLV